MCAPCPGNQQHGHLEEFGDQVRLFLRNTRQTPPRVVCSGMNNTDKIKQALTLLQEALDEKPAVVLTLNLTTREAAVLLAICNTNVTVPETVAEKRSTCFSGKTMSAARKEVCALLNKVKDQLPS